ncbi:MAG: hypothetical protein HY699_12035 [Deltaproteobacteria bacterium]|nr:hypothetical protein [Deltaproteobacteria bacterium]
MNAASVEPQARVRPRLSLSLVSEKAGALLPALTTGFAVILALRRMEDTDTWWHLAAGRWMVQHLRVPHTDTLSHTVPEHPWINLQWLYDVLLYALYQLGGADALVITTAVIFGLTIALVLKSLRSVLTPLTAAVLALWVVLTAEERLQIRPEIASFLFLQALLYLFASARRDGGRRLWLVPVVMLLWVNVHSLFIVGIFAIGCQMVAATAEHLPMLPVNWRRASSFGPVGNRRVLLSGGAAMLATLVNPYFATGVLFPFKLLSRINGSNPVFQSIGEFRPPFSGYFPTVALGAYQLFLMFSVLVVLSVVVLSLVAGRSVTGASGRAARRRQGGQAALAPTGRRAGLDLSGLLFFAGLAYLSLLARRNTALFTLGAAPFVGQCLALLPAALPQRVRQSLRPVEHALTAAMVPLLLLAGAGIASNQLYRLSLEPREFGTGVLAVNFPIRAAEFVKEMKLPPRLYNDLAAGGYLTWAAPSDGGVYIDGRLEVYDAEFFSAYMAALADPERWQAEADRRAISTAILFHRWSNRHTLISWLMASENWSLVYVDEVAIVFVRIAGNEELIAAALQRATAEQKSAIDDLLAPVTSWQWPSGRAAALSSYAEVLDLIGASEAAAQLYERWLELGVPAQSELPVRLRLAFYYTQREQLDEARRHVWRAEEIAPGEPEVVRLRASVGG